MQLVKFITNSDGPVREIHINPEFVMDVEQSVTRPADESFITLMDGRNYRVNVSVAVAVKRIALNGK
ncbi:hypothetical protein [Spirosoma litoris]